MRQVVLDRQHLVHMLVTEDFYKQVPAFAHLEQAATDLRQWAKDNGRCLCDINDRTMYQGLLDAFFLKIQEMVKTDDPGLQAMRRWVASKKKGSVQVELVIYYRDKKSGGTRKLIL